VYRVSVGKPKGKRPLERPKCRWENGITMEGSHKHSDEPLGSGATELVS
jgi:hypothetical protein